MAHGGARERAGRPKGSVALADQEARLKAAETGEMPLDYMLRVMRDEHSEERRRDDMAKSAAPFLHSKLANIEHTGKDGGPIKVNISGDDAGLL